MPTLFFYTGLECGHASVNMLHIHALCDYSRELVYWEECFNFRVIFLLFQGFIAVSKAPVKMEGMLALHSGGIIVTWEGAPELTLG